RRAMRSGPAVISIGTCASHGSTSRSPSDRSFSRPGPASGASDRILMRPGAYDRSRSAAEPAVRIHQPQREQLLAAGRLDTAHLAGDADLPPAALARIADPRLHVLVVHRGEHELAVVLLVHAALRDHDADAIARRG